MAPAPPHRRRRLPVHAAVVALALLPLLAGVTTAYAASPARGPAAGAAVAGNAPAATPSCQPWQTPTTVPPGVTLTPRVFPPAPRPLATTTATAAPTSVPTASASAPRPSSKGKAHGPEVTTTCQLHMRTFSDGDEITIEPWRADAFPVIKDLVVVLSEHVDDAGVALRLPLR